MSMSSIPVVSTPLRVHDHTNDVRFDTAFAQARTAGYVSITSPVDKHLFQGWSAWCGSRQMPIIQVCERQDTAWISVDAVFRHRLLSRSDLTQLHEAWQRYMPQPDALHGLTPMFCHFAGLDVRRAHRFAQEIVQLLQDVPRSSHR